QEGDGYFMTTGA
nr:immunoglobulin heavy chain junction region [Mus musculus]